MNETLPIKQSKFSNGEISPASYGDTKNPKFESSLKLCLNWLPIQNGSVSKRPGTKFIAPIKQAAFGARLFSFIFSDQQAFVLEVGNLYIRFYRNGQYVGADFNLHTFGDAYAGGYYELTTTITTTMLPFLLATQVGDVITFTYGNQNGGGNFAPVDVRHTAGVNGPWTFSVTLFAAPAYPGLVAPRSFVFLYGTPPSLSVHPQGDRVYTSSGGVNTEWICIQDVVPDTGGVFAPPSPPVLNATTTGVNGTLYWQAVIDLAHQAAQWRFCYTVTFQNATDGTVYESAPSPIYTTNTALSADRALDIGLATALAAPPAGYVALLLSWFRAGASSIFGWIKDTKVTDGGYLDVGQAPDFTRQPPQGTDPFLVNGVDSFPAVLGYIDQRRAWGNSVRLPSIIQLSKIGDLFNYDGRNLPGSDKDAMLNVAFASDVLEDIRSITALKRTVVLTGQGEWLLAGQGGSPISRSNLDVKRQSKWGSSWLKPLVIGNGLLFCTSKSNMIRDLYPLYGIYTDTWDGQDLTVMAKHLFDLHTIKAWAFQSVPYPVVYMVREDGVLLSCTYQHAPASFGQQLTEGVVAWAQHNTGSGDSFEDVCVVPEPPEDAVYAIVRRFDAVVGTKRYIERFNRIATPGSPYVPGVPDIRYAMHTDCTIVYDGHNDQLGGANPGASAWFDSVLVPGSQNPADYVAGTAIKITVGSGATPFAAVDAAAPYASAFVFDPENVFNVGPVRAHITGFTSSTVVTAELDAPCTLAQLQRYTSGFFTTVGLWGLAKGVLASPGFGVLAGFALDSGLPNGSRGLIALVDGDVQIPATFVNGVANFAVPGLVIRLGLAYNADLSLLDAYDPRVEVRQKFKNILRVAFEVYNTRDMWFGKNALSLTQWQQRNVTDAYGVVGLATGYYEEFVMGEYGKTGQLLVRHFNPFPATLTSILREMRLGDT